MFSKTQTIVYLSFLGLLAIAIGCGRGCSCSRTIATDREKLEIDGEKVRVTAKKIETKTTYLKRVKLPENEDDDFVCQTRKTYHYAFSYDIKLSGRPELEDVCSFPIDENTDIAHAMPAFSMKFSPDKQHFAVGIGQEVYGIYHLLEKGIPFSTHYYNYLTKTNNTFEQLQWDTISPPDKIIESIISHENQYEKLTREDISLITRALQDQEPANKYDYLLIKLWPQSDLADKVFSEKRIRENCDNSKGWETLALQKVFSSLNSGVYDNRNILMLIAIDDKQSFLEADKILFTRWPRSDDVHQYLLKRLKMRRPKIDDSQIKSLIAKGNQAITNLSNRKLHEKRREIEHSLEFLLEIEETSQFEEAFRLFFVPENYEDYKTIVNETITEYYENFPAPVQDMVKQKLPQMFPHLNFPERSEMFDFLKDKIACEILVKLKQNYANDLKSNQLPTRCQ